MHAKRKKGRYGSPLTGYLMLIPAVLLIMLTQLYPFLYGLGLSFTDYNLINPRGPRFIGLQNFADILTKDTTFWNVIGFSIIYTLGIVVFSYLLGLILAMLLNRPIRFRGFFRAIVLIPWVISSMVMASNWLWLLNDRFGFINQILQRIGLTQKPILFLATAGMARFTVTAIGVWRNLPFMTVTLLAGLQGVPADLYEAAKIDGAGPLQTFRYITLPMIRGVTLISTTLMFIWAFNGFENIFLLTEGGPVGATMVVPIYAYQTAFMRSQMGYASALSVVLMVIMLIFSAIRLRLNKESQ